MTLQTDSKKVKSGDIFFALPSVAGRDTLPFVQEAFSNGAKTLIVEKNFFSRLPEEVRIACKAVPDVLEAFNKAASEHFVPKPKTIVAVTGTNGKTSIVNFIRQLWEACDIKSASLGTMGVQGEYVEGISKAGLTTADALTLHKTLQSLGKKGIEAVALEASSHGLHQKRLDGLEISAAVFTNLSRDHLDYHASEKDYFDAKARLFLEILPLGAPAIICGDDAWGEKLAKLCRQKEHKTITYGAKEKNDWQIVFHRDPQGQKITVRAPEGMGGEKGFFLPLVGDFQALNAIAAAIVLMQVSGVSADEIFQRCEVLQPVKGRLECVGQTKTGGSVFVDYAHTPDALERALRALRPQTKGKLWVVFGCGGDRDAGKRSVMGGVAKEFADNTLVTDDNPRTEEPKIITRQILESGVQAQVIHDRKKAIETGVSQLKQGDILLIAGKGHEAEQIIGTQAIPFDDAEIALEALRK
jgi:UDP-N-acetylmuramyl-tripeptide synthetase